MKYAYAATFTPGDGKYYVAFPDFPGCVTVGADLVDAMEMAEDVLSLWLMSAENHGEVIPAPSAPDAAACDPPAFTTIVKADTDAYRRLLEQETKERSRNLIDP